MGAPVGRGRGGRRRAPGGRGGGGRGGRGRAGAWVAGALGTGVPVGGALVDGAAPLDTLVGVVLGVPQAARSASSRSGVVSRAARLNIVDLLIVVRRQGDLDAGVVG